MRGPAYLSGECNQQGTLTGVTPDTHLVVSLDPPFAAYPVASGDTLAWLTTAQMIETDRLAIEGSGTGLLQMMEPAGSTLPESTNRVAPPATVS